MEQLIQEVRQALSHGLWLLALQGSLALIDISAAVQAESGRTDRVKFKAWFAEHLGEKYELFTAEDAYLLRCGMLHQGRASSNQYEAVIFTISPLGKLAHNNVINNTWSLRRRWRNYYQAFSAAMSSWHSSAPHEPASWCRQWYASSACSS